MASTKSTIAITLAALAAGAALGSFCHDSGKKHGEISKKRGDLRDKLSSMATKKELPEEYENDASVGRRSQKTAKHTKITQHKLFVKLRIVRALQQRIGLPPYLEPRILSRDYTGVLFYSSRYHER